MSIPDYNTLGYTGLKEQNPPNVRYFKKDPTPQDITGMDIGDFWVNTAVPQSWQLVAKVGGIATWILVGTGLGSLDSLTPDLGGAVFPTANNINIVGGAGITTANIGASTIRISVASSGFTWNSVTAATNPNLLVKENGYVPNLAAQVVFILPAAPAFGDVIEIVGTATGNLWTVTQNAGQTIRLGIQATTAGILGHLDATMVTDSVKLLCTAAITDFEIISITGNPNFL
jgi:hypothetical protein